jgi:hypothetical protein
MQRIWTLPSQLLLCLAALHHLSGAVGAEPPSPKDIEFFEQRIRPVLVGQCYGCHSHQAQANKKLQAGLFLDSSAGMLAGGESGPVIVKGKSGESLLIKALRYDGFQMPPTGKLSADVIADFAKWIDMGAPDPRKAGPVAKAKREINVAEGRKWWSFHPLKAVTPPPAPGGWQAPTPIDQFIVAEQAKRKLKPSGPAEKEKLIRRAYFDLIGLPPSVEQVEAFVRDASPQAFEKVVDELLASRHYGEKWARHWLDVARYAESGGYEFDGFRPGAYHYRDWVIRALNADMPYDQFVRWQLAGDRLQPDDYHAAAAAGFLVAGPYPGQITAKTVERIRYDQLDDMLMTIGGSMLGLTLGCVRCHEHKYDPIPQADYYGLAASLASTVQGTRVLDPDPAATQKALELHRQDREKRLTALARFAADELPKHFDAWRAAELPTQPDAPRWQVLEPVALDAERSYLKWLPDGTVAHDGLVTTSSKLPRRGQRRLVPAAEQYQVTFHTYQKNVTALRLDAFADKSLPQRGPGLNGDGSFQLTELTVTARPLDPQVKDAPQVLKLKAALAAFADKDQPLANAVDGKPATAWVVRTTAKQDNAAVFELEKPLPGFASGTELVFELKFRDLGLGRMRFSVSTEPNPATWAGASAPQHLGEIRAILAVGGNKLPETLRLPMTRWFAPFDAETAKAFQVVRGHDAAEPRPAVTEVYSATAGGQDVFFLRRGEVDNKQGKAEPGVVQALWRGAHPPARSATDPRISLADWMTNVEHGAGPLLARVMANRLWQHHFGEGIVRTPNDFGAQGERPTHPDLLEWLATELVRGGWRLKPLHKAIMLSAIYQQSHEVVAENQQIDPANRYLWHHRPRRLEAEIIRDALLAVAGSLDTAMYGPSILDNTPRRSIYLRVKRSELIPLMTMFDAPEPTQSIGQRISTTVPTQALAMMNSPFVRQQAERLAQRVLPAKDAPLAGAIDRAYQVALARRPQESERARMLAFVEAQRSALGNDPAATGKALTEFCQVLLCLNEFVYVD